MSLEARQPVIAGISGRYPNSDNLEQFWNNLMNGAQMCSVDDTRWPVGFMGLPKRTGKIKRIDRFDYEFFNVNEFDANFMDPQLRLLHETTYEAIWDAGIDPNRLRGSNTGVYVGLCYSDTDTALKEDDSSPVNYIQCEASRLSYAFDFRGPAVVVDTACASMFTALNEGLVALKNELCDNLIVAGAAQESSMITNDFLALLNDVSKIGYESGLYYRGFMIIDEYNKPTKCVIHGCHKTPLCFAFLEEEQTFNIYKDIFKMKIIEVSFNVSCEIMKTVGIPLREIISNRKRKNVNNVTGKVLNAALIIALIEVLKFLGVTPSRIISSSNGEILSAFARGCINHRQALLLTFFAANRNQNGHGSMLRAICSQIIKRKANCQCGNICHSFNGPMKRNGSSTLSDALFSTKNEICVDAGDLSNDISIITFTSREIFENTFTGARTSRLYSPFYREDNSKQKNQTATVESVHHVPFTGCVDESADDDEEFNVYSERCLKHLNEIISSTANDENNDNDEVEHNDNEDANESEVNACKKFENGEQYALLSALNEAIAEKKSALQTLQMLRSKSNKELANDLIFKHSETQLFQPFIELIFENTRSKYLNVLEANISTSSVCETIASLFDFYDCYERNYVVIHSEKSLKVKKEIVNSIYKMKADESIIPNSITNLDIVIVKDENTTSYFSSKMLSSERLKRFLHSCYEAMNESAFLLWYTREEMTKIERTLYAAVNEQPVTLFDFNQVMSIMSEAKFTYIGKRTNSKRAMVLLFRKCMPYDLQPILIETKAFSFDWIETLKREVKCERNNKIWLLADEDFSGIVGFHDEWTIYDDFYE
ncbi:hypothetical protein B4U79_10038, partial [Dinothrombium tinctorium]